LQYSQFHQEAFGISLLMHTSLATELAFVSFSDSTH
jgi:hypothetical protein